MCLLGWSLDGTPKFGSHPIRWNEFKQPIPYLEVANRISHPVPSGTILLPDWRLEKVENDSKFIDMKSERDSYKAMYEAKLDSESGGSSKRTDESLLHPNQPNQSQSQLQKQVDQLKKQLARMTKERDDAIKALKACMKNKGH